MVEVHEDGERVSEDDLAERPQRPRAHMLELGAQPGHAVLLGSGAQQLHAQQTRHGACPEPAKGVRSFVYVWSKTSW